jgi:hypothetical protein
MIPTFFTEDNGSPSMMRLMCLLALLCALGLSWYEAISGKNDVTIIAMLLGAAFGGKLVQKLDEEKGCTPPSNPVVLK